ncbi:MAG: hypothetical protein RSB51_04510 [Clostridia bacterium]
MLNKQAKRAIGLIASLVVISFIVLNISKNKELLDISSGIQSDKELTKEEEIDYSKGKDVIQETEKNPEITYGNNTGNGSLIYIKGINEFLDKSTDRVKAASIITRLEKSMDYTSQFLVLDNKNAKAFYKTNKQKIEEYYGINNEATFITFYKNLKKVNKISKVQIDIAQMQIKNDEYIFNIIIEGDIDYKIALKAVAAKQGNLLGNILFII